MACLQENINRWDMRLVLITGANGFVGHAMCAEMAMRGFPVRALVRNGAKCALPSACEIARISSLSYRPELEHVLNGVETVIHLAARVHVMQEHATNRLEEFRKVNVAGTEHLARVAVACGVKRFVFVSSVKVNGEVTQKNVCFSEADEPLPQDPYGVSKWEAEQALHRVAAETGLEVVIVRPPLVYGANVKGNFATMLKVLRRGIPLPLASVLNLRSLVYVENLVDALITCARHPAAAGQTYLVSDGEDVSTPDLLRSLGDALGRPARLLPCPVALLQLGARLLGKSGQIERLLGSLRLDSSKIRRELGWQPPYSLQQGLRASVAPEG